MPDVTEQPTTNPYRDRIRHLGHVIDNASADRELAMLRAHQHGATHEEIAHWALTGVPDVRSVIDSLTKEEGVEEWPDGPEYVTLWPHGR
jgi:hypothetical protein